MDSPSAAEMCLCGVGFDRPLLSYGPGQRPVTTLPVIKICANPRTVRTMSGTSMSTRQAAAGS
jgi:hypothetical protein